MAIRIVLLGTDSKRDFCWWQLWTQDKVGWLKADFPVGNERQAFLCDCGFRILLGRSPEYVRTSQRPFYSRTRLRTVWKAAYDAFDAERKTMGVTGDVAHRPAECEDGRINPDASGRSRSGDISSIVLRMTKAPDFMW